MVTDFFMHRLENNFEKGIDHFLLNISLEFMKQLAQNLYYVSYIILHQFGLFIYKKHFEICTNIKFFS